MSANERKVVHDHLEGALRPRDVQRGRGRRPLRDRRSAGRATEPTEPRRARLRPEARLSDRIEVVLSCWPPIRAPSRSVRDPEQGRRAHVADSLTGLEVEALRSAAIAIADVGCRRRISRPRARRTRYPGSGRPGRVGRAQVRVHARGDRRLGDRQRQGRSTRARRTGPPSRLRWARGLRLRHRPGGRSPGDAGRARLAAAARGRRAGRLEGPARRWTRKRSSTRPLEATAMEAARGPRGGGEGRLRAPPPLRALASQRPDPRRACPRRSGAGEEASLAPAPPPGSLRRDGCRLRDREPEGRGGEDDHRGQRRRLQVAAEGNQVLLVDLDQQANATVALGLDRDTKPSSYDCLMGDSSVAEAARPAGPTTSGSSRPAATSPAPPSSCRGSTTWSSSSATASARCASASR